MKIETKIHLNKHLSENHEDNSKIHGYVKDCVECEELKQFRFDTGWCPCCEGNED